MINNGVIRNCQTLFPILNMPFNEQVMGKIETKNVYQTWNGESIEQIRDSATRNPFSLHIGTPATDQAMRTDRVYFILHYMSYNPLTKDIEARHLIPHRNVEKIYIGQSLDEKYYKDYRLFVDGVAVVDDVQLKSIPSLRDISVGKVLINLISKVEALQQDVVNLKRQLAAQHTYAKGNESTIQLPG